MARLETEMAISELTEWAAYFEIQADAEKAYLDKHSASGGSGAGELRNPGGGRRSRPAVFGPGEGPWGA